MYTDPTVADFKAYFTRDFAYGNTPDVVNDSDIQRAITEVTNRVNQCLCATQAFYTQAFLYFSAHRLVMNIKNSSSGLASSPSWLLSSKGVGSVSTSNAIPQWILNNPEFTYLCKTGYGMEYLMMMLPTLSGAFGTVSGATKP